jgi:hypothetical protein
MQGEWRERQSSYRQRGRGLWQGEPLKRGRWRDHAVGGQHAQRAMVQHGHAVFRGVPRGNIGSASQRARSGANFHPWHMAALAPSARTRDRGGQCPQQHHAQHQQAEPAQLSRCPGHGFFKASGGQAQCLCLWPSPCFMAGAAAVRAGTFNSTDWRLPSLPSTTSVTGTVSPSLTWDFRSISMTW